MTGKKLTDKIETEILARLQQGETLSSICRADQMPTNKTVARWQREDSELDDRIIRARQSGVWALFDRAMDEINDCRTDQIPLVREKLTHLRWVMTRLAPSEFGNQSKLKIEVDPAPTFVDVLRRAAVLEKEQKAKLIQGEVIENKLII